MAELRTLARPYAKAAFAFANEAEALEQWEQQLRLLAALAQQPKVSALISSPTIEATDQAKQLAALADDLSSEANQFLQVLATYKRLPLLPSIAELFTEYKAERERKIAVQITSAFSVDDEASQKLGAALKQKLDREVDVAVDVDKALLGGVVIRAGDIVIDASIKGRLAKLAETMAI